MLLFFLVCVGFGNELDLSQILFVSETPFRQTLDCISTGKDFRKQFPRKLQISPFWTFYGGDYVRPETKCHHSASIPCFRAVTRWKSKQFLKCFDAMLTKFDARQFFVVNDRLFTRFQSSDFCQSGKFSIAFFFLCMPCLRQVKQC